MQVTAFDVITKNGQTGTLPIGVNFQIGSDSTASKTTSGSSAYSGAPSQVPTLLQKQTFARYLLADPQPHMHFALVPSLQVLSCLSGKLLI